MAGTYARTCADGGNVYDALSCAERALNSSKRDLNAIYGKLYESTQYKEEFQQSQQAWLAYREKQCN
ncbi:lysozyme inhibitor LprI family protein, partial [Paraburkholderia sp. SIMBA_055]